ncbi:polysaccharide deacetylase family protein [uncultured Parasphingorhabdus sp.]|uniref:polysaccharide deacetylase family protein n=1 Tax=uncultured Parasphingorhabdus sp. TaxID=2709694 RepID=UPI0030DD683F|tara:strand:+ start:69682 stop:70668 length:987 start_codon:yes stop_codon:yes gene_type:complete
MKIHKPDSHVLWPEEFGRRFLISIDTEEEFDWDAPFERRGHTTITVPMLEKYQEFVEKYGIKPVYFVDYAIIQDPKATAFLRTVTEQQSATIGVHLHPWVNPPFDERVNDHNSFAGNLPKELEEEKLVKLRDAIRDRIGVTPNTYRAGRYGIGPNTVELLLKHGFALDSSIRPRFDYSGEGGPDFLSVDSRPYWWGKDERLLEVPLTTVYSGIFRKQHRLAATIMEKSPLANALLSRSKMLERIPLTPEGISARETKEAIDVALDDDLRLLVFSFHSPSLSPGHTPYVRDQNELDGFYDWWREVLDHLEARNVKPVDIDELLRAASGS